MERYKQLFETKKDKNVLEFNATKMGWKSIEDAEKKASEISLENKDHFIYMSIMFDIVFIKIGSKDLNKSAFGPDDSPYGYWKNGKKYEWSKARKIRAQNAGLRD